MKQILIFTVCVFLVFGCDSKTNEVVSDQPPKTDAPMLVAQDSVREDDIGDLEQAISVLVAVADKSQADTIKEEALKDAGGRMHLLTIDVAEPYPEKLFLNFAVNTSRRFPVNPGALRFKIKREDETLLSISALVGKEKIGIIHAEQVDVLAGLDAIPESLLLTIESEVALMPVGTPEDSIDPETATSTPDRTSTAMATPPVRINFTAGAQPKPASAESVENTETAPADETTAETESNEEADKPNEG